MKVCLKQLFKNKQMIWNVKTQVFKPSLHKVFKIFYHSIIVQSSIHVEWIHGLFQVTDHVQPNFWLGETFNKIIKKDNSSLEDLTEL